MLFHYTSMCSFSRWKPTPPLYSLTHFNFMGLTLPQQPPAEHRSSPHDMLKFIRGRKGHLHHHPIVPTQHQVLWNYKGKRTTKSDLYSHLTCARLPWWLSGEELACQHRRHRWDPWVGKIPWRRKWQPTPVI